MKDGLLSRSSFKGCPADASHLSQVSTGLPELFTTTLVQAVQSMTAPYFDQCLVRRPCVVASSAVGVHAYVSGVRASVSFPSFVECGVIHDAQVLFRTTTAAALGLSGWQLSGSASMTQYTVHSNERCDAIDADIEGGVK